MLYSPSRTIKYTNHHFKNIVLSVVNSLATVECIIDHKSPQRFELHIGEARIPSGLPVFAVVLPRLLSGAGEPPGFVGDVEFLATFPPVALHALELELQGFGGAQVTLFKCSLIRPEPIAKYDENVKLT